MPEQNTGSAPTGLPAQIDSYSTLLPAEKMALTVSLAQVRRGEPPMPNTATMCVLALARLVGEYDYMQELDAHDHEDGD